MNRIALALTLHPASTQNHAPKPLDPAQIPIPYVDPSPGAETNAGLPFRQPFVTQDEAGALFGMTY
jgi:hypothetical protein